MDAHEKPRTLYPLDNLVLPALLPLDPVEPAPAEIAPGLEAYRNGDTGGAMDALREVAGTGRTAVAGSAAAALAGIELGAGLPCRESLEQVAAGEDPWLGPLAGVLSAELEPEEDGPALLRGVTARLTGDAEAARAHYAEADGGLATVLLGEVLLAGGDHAAAEEPLARALRSDGDMVAAYAGHLLSHILIARDDLETAGNVLNDAFWRCHPRGTGPEGLVPWVGVRIGELLAGTYMLDVVDALMEKSGMSELYFTRDFFENAFHFTKYSEPSLAKIGLFLFPGDLGPVRDALERLRAWSDERHERGRALTVLLGRRLLEDMHTREDGYRPLRELVADVGGS
ncbi:tetratricopeptide repeat protein [Actinomadura sp. LOL_016]|uniref:tetratricopeptide repeat protein n=1 Tax=unclassified Actinomadura TaxID=2626254 RepID=UPI003A8133AC